jgi:hypothetical protein
MWSRLPEEFQVSLRCGYRGSENLSVTLTITFTYLSSNNNKKVVAGTYSSLLSGYWFVKLLIPGKEIFLVLLNICKPHSAPGEVFLTWFRSGPGTNGSGLFTETNSSLNYICNQNSSLKNCVRLFLARLKISSSISRIYLYSHKCTTNVCCWTVTKSSWTVTNVP